MLAEARIEPRLAVVGGPIDNHYATLTPQGLPKGQRGRKGSVIHRAMLK